MNNNWDFLLYKFNKLGGKAINVQQKRGNKGRGIFAFMPDKKSEIFTPSSLIINVDNIVFNDNKLTLKNEKIYSKEVTNFLNFYLNEISFEYETKTSLRMFEKDLFCLTPLAKEIFKKYLLFNIEKRRENQDRILFKSYIASRVINFNNKKIICPILELINHDEKSSACLVSKKGIKSPTYFPFKEELTIKYSNQSSLKRFLQYHFFSKEKNVFSLPFSINLNNSDIFFECNGRDIDASKTKLINKYSNKIIIDGLPIAVFRNESLPIEYFQKVLKKIENIHIDKNLFKVIINYNLSIRKLLQEEIISINNQTTTSLSKVLHYEINLINSTLL